MAEFFIPGKNAGVFAAAVQCLGKIGKELYFEMGDDSVRSAPGPAALSDAASVQVVLRTLNDAKSAFAAFHFNMGKACTGSRALALDPCPQVSLSTRRCLLISAS